MSADLAAERERGRHDGGLVVALPMDSLGRIVNCTVLISGCPAGRRGNLGVMPQGLRDTYGNVTLLVNFLRV